MQMLALYQEKKKKSQGKCWPQGDFRQVTILTFIFLTIKYRWGGPLVCRPHDALRTIARAKECPVLCPRGLWSAPPFSRLFGSPHLRPSSAPGLSFFFSRLLPSLPPSPSSPLLIGPLPHRFCVKRSACIYLIYSSHKQSYKVRNIIIRILRLKRLSLREVKSLA